MYLNDDNTTVYNNFSNMAKQYPNYTAYEFFGEKCTYKNFLTKIDNVAKALDSIGIKENDIICVSLPNIPQTLHFLYAINKIGATINFINCLSSEDELLEYINLTKAKGIIILDQFYNQLNNIKDKTSLEYIITTSIIDEFPIYKKIACKLFNKRNGYTSYKINYKNNVLGKKINELPYNIFMKYGKNNNKVLKISNHINECSFIIFSGGTTGKIKGVCLSNKNINNATKQLRMTIPKYLPGDKIITALPITHTFGLIVGTNLMLSYGGACVLMPKYTIEAYASTILKHKCNLLLGVVSIYDKLIYQDILKDKDLSFIKYAFTGADILACDTENRINDFLHSHKSKAKIKQGYGLTESTMAGTSNPDDKEKIGSIGKPLNEVNLKIIDPKTNKILNKNEVGEIIINSESNMLEYFNNKTETEKAFITINNRKYIHTGDLAYIDDDGYIFLKGRIKRLIIINGRNVFPLEIEEKLLKCEIIDSCCVIGVPDGSKEKIIAYIKLKKVYEKNDNEKQFIFKYLETHMPKYAIPKEIIFVDNFPKTKVGKIDFKMLKDEYIKDQN